MLLVTLPGEDEATDYVFYLDCQTLVPGEAVLARWAVGPAASFDANADRFDVLHVALPREADALQNSGSPLFPLYLYSQFSPPFARFHPRSIVMSDRDGVERGFLTLVDGDERTRVVTIENSGEQPLAIDPEQFTVTPDLDLTATGAAPGVRPAQIAWEGSNETGPRRLAPGERATVVLTFPERFADLIPDAKPAYLVYWDDTLPEAHLTIDCFGCAGGLGSRPELLLSR
jgi:hypothetical protein